MSDQKVAAHIERLVAEEHELQRQEERDRSDATRLPLDRDRLQAVRVELDRCWDLLRQRRALRGAGADPDTAQSRPADIVENYRQ